ncbi:MAG TPA: thiamine phosphate synthase [Terriglobales bacterium]|nr:thiamine phosphate synthase [Terriglobales bacterium]
MKTGAGEIRPFVFPDVIQLSDMPELLLPKVYPILDTARFADRNTLFAFAEALQGCGMLQYRNKNGTAKEMLSDARELRRRLGRRVLLIMNDRADLALAADFDGVHVGQDDLSVEAVRKVVGPKMIVGASTHNPEQLREGDATSADYLAIGPVYATSSKANPDPVVGLEGVRRARELTRKPLVAIGGINVGNAAEVTGAGADSLALISSLFPDPAKSVEQFRQLLL